MSCSIASLNSLDILTKLDMLDLEACVVDDPRIVGKYKIGDSVGYCAMV